MATIPGTLNTGLTDTQVMTAFENALEKYPQTAAEVTAARGSSANLADRLDGLDTAINNKQDTLNAAQLAAVNSGITSTDLEQIETNKNNILTDEAALVELIDGGAKNLLDLSNVVPTVPSGLTCANNGDGTYTVSGTLSSANSIKFAISAIEGSLILSGCPSGGGDSSYMQRITKNGTAVANTNDTGSGSGSFSMSGTGYELNFRFAAGTYTDVMFKPMICTKAAWDISQTYQPYRPSYQELYDEVQAKITKSEVYNRGTAISTGDDLNGYTSLGKFYAATGAIAESLTNCPITTGFVMAVEASFQSGRMQTLVTIESGGNATITYRRSQVYRSGVWSWLPWYKFEGTAVT